ncbi:MAG: fatty acid desaturase [Alphaproteobacteria bacterium]|jgi:fatty acid desaturase
MSLASPKIDKSFMLIPFWKVPLHTFVLFSLYSLLGYLAYTQEFGYLAWPLMGVILSGNLAAAHDCLHCTQYKNRKLNHIFGIIWCMPLIMNFSIYRKYHLKHHRFTGVAGDSESREPFESLQEYLWTLTGYSFFRKFIIKQLNVFKGDYVEKASASQIQAIRFDCFFILLWLFFVIFMTFSNWMMMLMIYWGPLAFYPMMLIIIGIPEHYDCIDNSDVKKNTRSVSSNFLVRFFVWNSNFHAEHHYSPAVPTLNLKALHKELQGVFTYTEKSYFKFHKNLFLKLLNKSKGCK